MTATWFPHSSLDAHVAQQMTQTLYYTPAWLDLITEIYGYSAIPVTATNASGQVTGCLPLCFIQSTMTGRRLVSLPFSDHCPLLAADEASANDLVEQAIRLAQEKRVKYLELRTGINNMLAGRSGFVASDLYVRWLKPLTPDVDALLRSVDGSVRRAIKKAERLGVHVRMAQDRAEMEHFYRLHLRTRSKKLGMPAQPRRYFFTLWDNFAPSGTMQLWLAEQQGVVVAGSIFLTSGTTLKLAYNASDERYLHVRPVNLLLWIAMQWAAANGYDMFDIGRTARDNPGLMRFKRHMGAIMEPLPYYYYPRMAGLAATSERSWSYRLLTGCWKRFPLQLAAPVGGHLYKHLG
jgi:FemAB-related protein (PEP-CTERM system-associated)